MGVRARATTPGVALNDLVSNTHSTIRDLTSLRDEELLELVLRRQDSALGEMYDRYGRVIYTIALRITGDRETAEEVVQDVFQNVWQAAGGFQAGTGSFSSWLFGIARHRAIDATRSKRERARTREQNLDDKLLLAADTDIERTVDQSLLRDAVRKALKELPNNQRQAVELAYYGELTRVEIAAKLGEPVGTVKTRLRLGLTKLRDLLSGLDEE
jgi:RNA polymerase sigma-70 factor, ECF subfamily